MRVPRRSVARLRAVAPRGAASAGCMSDDPRYRPGRRAPHARAAGAGDGAARSTRRRASGSRRHASPGCARRAQRCASARRSGRRARVSRLRLPALSSPRRRGSPSAWSAATSERGRGLGLARGRRRARGAAGQKLGRLLILGSVHDAAAELARRSRGLQCRIWRHASPSLNRMSISLTTAAAERVRTFLAERGHGVGLRLGVQARPAARASPTSSTTPTRSAPTTWCSKTGRQGDRRPREPGSSTAPRSISSNRASTRPSASATRTSRANAAAARASASDCRVRAAISGPLPALRGILRRYFRPLPRPAAGCAVRRHHIGRFQPAHEESAWRSSAPCPSSSPTASHEPDRRGLSPLREGGLTIVAARMLQLSQRAGRRFLRRAPRASVLHATSCSYMTSGPVMVQVLEGENAIAKNREIMGATDPKKAAPGTIRADLADEHRSRTSCTARTAPRTPRAKSRTSSPRPSSARAAR